MNPAYEDLVEKRRLALCWRLSGYLESCPRSLLGEHSNSVMIDRGNFYGLVGHRLDTASGRDLFEFKH